MPTGSSPRRRVATPKNRPPSHARPPTAPKPSAGATAQPRKSMAAIVREAEIARLRRFFLPILVVKARRRRRLHQRAAPAVRPAPEELARFVAENCSFLSRCPGDLLLKLCQKPLYRFAFAGEVLCYAGEQARSHGLLLVLSGCVGYVDDAGTTADEAAAAATGLFPSLLSVRPSSGSSRAMQPPSPRKAAVRATPSKTYAAPSVLGEMLCLTDGIENRTLRAMGLTDVAIINAGEIQSAIASMMTPETLNDVMCREVRLARMAVLRRHFEQTAPLLGQSWICADMKPSQLRALIGVLEPDVAVPGQDIVAQGTTGATMFFIRRGTAQVLIDGKPIPGATPGPGAVFGEMGVLFQDRRMATVRAVTVCDLWVLSKPALERIVRHTDAKDSIIAAAARLRTGMVGKAPRDVIFRSLASHAVFGRLSHDVLADLVEAAIPRVFPAGKVIVSAAHRCSELIVLHTGVAASQDVFGIRYERGSVIGDMLLCPHRSLETIASISMVDAFVFPLRPLRFAMQRQGLLDDAVRDSEKQLVALARRRGLTATLLTTKALAQPQHLVVPVQKSTDAVAGAEHSDGGDSDDFPAKAPPRRQPPVIRERHALNWSKRRLEQKYAQPELTLARDPSMLAASQRAADREATQLLNDEDAGANVKAPNPNTVARALRFVRGGVSVADALAAAEASDGDDESAHSLVDALHPVSSSGDIDSDFLASDKWRAHDLFRELLATNKRFLVDLAHLPTAQHHSFAAITIRAYTKTGAQRRLRTPVQSDPNTPASPALAREGSTVSTRDQAAPVTRQERAKAARAQLRRDGALPCADSQTNDEESQRTFRPQRANSYAPVFPLCTQRHPTAHRHSTPTSGVHYQLTPTAREVSQPFTDFQAPPSRPGSTPGRRDSLRTVPHVPVDQRRFVPNAEELDEFMADVLAGAHGSQAGKAPDGENTGNDAATADRPDRDFLSEAWQDINVAMIEVSATAPPLTYAHYRQPHRPHLSGKGGERVVPPENHDGPDGEVGGDHSASNDCDAASDIEGEGVRPQVATPRSQRLHAAKEARRQPSSARGQPFIPGSHHKSRSPAPPPHGLPRRPPTLHELRRGSAASVRQRNAISVPPELYATPRGPSRSDSARGTSATTWNSESRAASAVQEPSSMATQRSMPQLHPSERRVNHEVAARAAHLREGQRIRYLAAAGPGVATTARSVGVLGPVPLSAGSQPGRKGRAATTPSQSPRTQPRFASDFVGAWAAHQRGYVAHIPPSTTSLESNQELDRSGVATRIDGEPPA